jgi:copper chaperone NosL
MTLNGQGLTGACLVATLALASCGGPREVAPPEVRYGEHPCDICVMIVNEERYAAAVVTCDEHGVTQSFVFDDIGCMLDFAPPAGHSIAARYVHDHGTLAWIDAETAAFLHSRELHTPMAFGVACFDSAADAETLRQSIGGDLLDFEGVRNRHAEGRLSLLALDDER